MATITYKDGGREEITVYMAEIQPSGVLITIVGGVRRFISSDAIKEITFNSDETVIPFGEGKRE